MELQIVDFETAKLLKEKGFDWACITYYDFRGFALPDGNIVENDILADWNNMSYHDWTIENLNLFSRPTLALAQKWLREVHRIECFIEPVHMNLRAYYVLHGVYTSYETRDFPLGERPHFDTYEQAQIRGIKDALKLI